jgi:hypothetical protein
MSNRLRGALAKGFNKLVAPLGLRCVQRPQVLPAPELSEDHVRHARLLPNRTDILHQLGRQEVIAEVGVGFGSFSRQIIDIMRPTKFIAVDTFQLDTPSWTGRHAYGQILGELSHEAFYRQKFKDEIASGQVDIRRGFSHHELSTFEDAFFDMIYIDAAHDYESVKRDLAVANRKVKLEGFIVLNDFTVMDPLLLQHYDITRATQEFCLEHDWEFVYLALHRFMFCDVALRRMARGGK